MFKLHKVIKEIVITKRFFSYNPNLLISEENKEKCMRKFRAMWVKQGSKEIIRKAAVLIPVVMKDQDVSLLYTLRAANLRTHRGQISFPGGLLDDSDNSVEEAALRETEEELGIRPDAIEVWGSGNPIIRQEMAVIPVVGNIKLDYNLKEIRVNQLEVEDVFTVKIQDLINPKYHRHTQFRRTYSTPTYFGGPYRIWGLTAVITFMFLKALLPPNVYTYQIKYIPDIINTSQH